MTKEREALTLALEALEGWGKGFPDNWGDLDTEAITAIKEALAQTEERNFCSRCGKRLASGFVEISIHTCTPPQPEKEQEIKDLRTPEERREAGQWHCPECFTFGYVHKRGCVTALKEKNT